MKDNHFTPVPGLGLLAVRSPTANSFLQGLVTCDVSQVSEANSLLGAHCNSKGRILFSFRLFLHDGVLYLKMPQEMIDRAIHHLQKYAMFSKVTLEKLPVDSENKNSLSDINAWILADIQAGIATVYPATEGLFIPQMLNYSQLGALSFIKGCYIGQEIVARTEHLGKLKRHLHHAIIKAPEKTFSPGDVITRQDQDEIGSVANAALDNDKNWQLLVVLQDEAVKNADTLFCHDSLIQLTSAATEEKK